MMTGASLGSIADRTLFAAGLVGAIVWNSPATILTDGVRCEKQRPRAVELRLRRGGGSPLSRIAHSRRRACEEAQAPRRRRLRAVHRGADRGLPRALPGLTRRRRAVQRARAQALAEPADVSLVARLRALRRSAAVLRASIAI